MSAIRIGTRASLLAKTQSELVAGMVRDRLGRQAELVEVTTEGTGPRRPALRSPSSAAPASS